VDNKFIEWAYFNRDTRLFLHTCNIPGLKAHCEDIIEVGLTTPLDYSYNYSLDIDNTTIIQGEQHPASPMPGEESL
jgi:hypothetical protein